MKDNYFYCADLAAKLKILRDTQRVPNIKTQEDMARMLDYHPGQFSKDINGRYLDKSIDLQGKLPEGRLPMSVIEEICALYNIDKGDMLMPSSEFKRFIAKQESPWNHLVEKAAPAEGFELLPEHPEMTTLSIGKRWQNKSDSTKYPTDKEFFLRLQVMPYSYVIVMVSDGAKRVVLTDVQEGASMTSNEAGLLTLPGYAYREGFDFQTPGEHRFLIIATANDWDWHCQQNLLSDDHTDQRIGLRHIDTHLASPNQDDTALLQTIKFNAVRP